LGIKTIQITRSKGFGPLSIFQDKFLEKLNFPTLFYGYIRPKDIVKYNLGIKGYWGQGLGYLLDSE